MKAPVVNKNEFEANPGYVRFIPTPSREMAGKGAPRSTTFGVMHQTKNDPFSKSLGGLVHDTKDLSPEKPGTIRKADHKIETERDILGNIGKTQVAKNSYGQVPYAGKYMTERGERL